MSPSVFAERYRPTRYVDSLGKVSNIRSVAIIVVVPKIDVISKEDRFLSSYFQIDDRL